MHAPKTTGGAPPHPFLLQVDEEASIRANTTVLLGNLADNLSGAVQAWRGGGAACRRAERERSVCLEQQRWPPDSAAMTEPCMQP